MEFNSFAFAFYLPVVFALYWALARRVQLQNAWVVVASYVFYGWWDWRFLILIAFTSGWSYFAGRMADVRRGVQWKWGWAWSSIVLNVGILCCFKYFNFFVGSAVTLLHSLGFNAHYETLKIILPVGISFYTFQALSYTIDVARGTILPTRNIVAFFAYISFFPQLVAGPIERATSLLPQFLKERRFDYPLAVEGCRQMLWGFFKKVLVADSCAYAANYILGNGNPSSVSVWAGMLCFTFQIYGDFSGYSDIAIGCAKLFGIRLMRNFDLPYFSKSVGEFWRRWHISLMTWFKDYLYIPLGGNRCGRLKAVRNTFAVFAVSGLWHGANWTFVIWGLYHALCLLPKTIFGTKGKSGDGGAFALFRTFLLVVIGWVFFRAPDLTTAWNWLCKMFMSTDFRVAGLGLYNTIQAFVMVGIMLAVEFVNRGRDIPRLPRNVFLRWGMYVVSACAICSLRQPGQVFVYFQF